MLAFIQCAFFQPIDKVQIFLHSLVRIERRLLGQIADQAADLLGVRTAVQSADGYGSVGRLQTACDDIHSRGFSGAVRSEKSHYLSFRHGK